MPPPSKIKELERKVESLLDGKKIREDEERQARETRLIRAFCAAARDLTTHMAALQTVVAELKEPVVAVLDTIRNLNSMQDGLTAMVKQSADQLDQFTKAVEILERSMSPTESNYSEFAEETEEGRERTQRAEVREMMRHGIPTDQARARIRERDIYSAMVKGK